MESKILKCIIAIISSVVIISFANTGAVSAASENEPSQNLQDGSFLVEPIFPSNQINTGIHFLYLKVKSGQMQKVQFLLENPTGRSAKIKIEPTVATTTNQGVIDYGLDKPKSGDNPPADFTKLGFESHIVSLAKKSSKLITLSFKIPDQNFEGLLMGGIKFTNLKSTPNKTNSKEHFQIDNRVSYVIAVGLQENDTNPKPDLKIGKIAPSYADGQPAMQIQLQNPEPMYLTNLKIKAKIEKDGMVIKSLSNSKKVHTQSTKGMEMAANSSFNYQMNWDKTEQISPGKYKLTLDASGSGKQWHLTKTFTVSREQANQVNAQNKAAKPDYMKYLWLIIAVIVVLLVSLVVFVFYLGQRHGQNQ